MPAKPKFYAVARGRRPGVYTDWPTAKSQVHGFDGARYKGFATREEAEAFVADQASPILAQLSRLGLVDPAATAATAAAAATASAAATRRPSRNPHSPDSLVVFTDGACTGNGRRGAKGGYAAVWPDHPELDVARPMGPADGLATNNRAEYLAFLAALDGADRKDPARAQRLYVYTDSQLLLKSIQEWMPRWRANGWRKADGGPVANQDLLERMDRYLAGAGAGARRIVWKHVAAHTGADDWESRWNAVADERAQAASKKGLGPTGGGRGTDV